MIMWRDAAMLAVQESVASLSLLPSRRDVTLAYRSGEIQAVPVSCISEQIELQIVAKMKSSAIAHKFLEPLDAETMLGFSSTAADLQLQVYEQFLEQVVLCLCLSNSILENSEEIYYYYYYYYCFNYCCTG